MMSWCANAKLGIDQDIPTRARIRPRTVGAGVREDVVRAEQVELIREHVLRERGLRRRWMGRARGWKPWAGTVGEEACG